MSIMRTEHEADSVDILKLVIETSDFYAEMSKVLEDKTLSPKLASISAERAGFIAPLRDMVKQQDQLPAQPDPEKELMQKVGGELTSLFSADSENSILDSCLQKDEKLAKVVKDTKLGEASAEFQQQLHALSQHLSATRQAVQALKS